MALFNTIVGFFPAGTYPFAQLSGQIPLPAEVVEELDREGSDGQAYRLLGKKSAPAELVGLVDMISAASARVLHSSLLELVGTLITIHDAHGERYDRVMLKHVQLVDGKRISNAI